MGFWSKDKKEGFRIGVAVGAKKSKTTQTKYKPQFKTKKQLGKYLNSDKFDPVSDRDLVSAYKNWK